MISQVGLFQWQMLLMNKKCVHVSLEISILFKEKYS